MYIQSLKAISLLCLFLLPVTLTADDRARGWDRGNRDYGEQRQTRDYHVAGEWRLGKDRVQGGFSIYRRDGRQWERVPGSALAVGDGWVIGTDRERGGYGIYRWNGRGWDKAPGGAVSIGGSYDQPWVINNQHEKYVWNGYNWDDAGRSQRGGSGVKTRGRENHRRYR